MKPIFLVALAASLLTTTACSKHDCSLDTPDDEQSFGLIAQSTSGASSCFVSNGELVATHGGSDIPGTANTYQSTLEGLGFTVEQRDHSGTRANGKPLEGKALTATKDGQSYNVLVYPLADTVIEAVISKTP